MYTRLLGPMKHGVWEVGSFSFYFFKSSFHEKLLFSTQITLNNLFHPTFKKRLIKNQIYNKAMKLQFDGPKFKKKILEPEKKFTKK